MRVFLDASAIVAILSQDAGYQSLVHRLEDFEGQVYTSPLARFEAVTALARKRSGSSSRPSPELIAGAQSLVDAFLAELEAEDLSITPRIGELAILACQSYGKAVGHPADLNFGDCFAYACAKAHGLLLVYTGNDFAKTDLA